ncbi:MAG: hypothetical protein IKH65_03370 [Clostridia bacterium]|nr:hypothetical protein [Clostridia bacterium]
MYYAILSVSVVLFGVQFLFNRQYQIIRGPSVRTAMLFMFTAFSAGTLILWGINKFRFEFTPFTLIVASVAAANSLAYSFCSIKALGKVNLSIYSVFAMLGGMVIPFIAGIVFFKEELTAGKIICLVLITVALALTISGKSKKSGLGVCFGIFIFNGLGGVYAKLFTSLDYPKTSEAGYSVLMALSTVVISGLMLIFIRRPEMKKSPAADSLAAGYGVVNCIGNLLLLIALRKLPASAQFPFITGGVMIVSTVISCFTKDKPSKREFVSVAVAFAGLLVLMITEEYM